MEYAGLLGQVPTVVSGGTYQGGPSPADIQTFLGIIDTIEALEERIDEISFPSNKF